jgi:hypothetical protein
MEGASMPDGYVTVATYETVIAAELARVKLDSEDIPVFIADAHTVSISSLGGIAIGVRVQVPSEMAGRASELLRDEEFPIFMDPTHRRGEPEEDDDEDDGEDEERDEKYSSDNRIADAAPPSGFHFSLRSLVIQIMVMTAVAWLVFVLLIERD